MAVKVKIEGFEEITAAIKNLGSKADAIVDPALEKAIEPIYKEIKSLAPYDSRPNSSPGHLKDNIPKNKIIKNGTNHYISVGWEKGDNSDYFYAKFPEWGTSKMVAKPFMQPGYQRKKNEALSVLANEIKKGLGL